MFDYFAIEWRVFFFLHFTNLSEVLARSGLGRILYGLVILLHRYTEWYQHSERDRRSLTNKNNKVPKYRSVRFNAQRVANCSIVLYTSVKNDNWDELLGMGIFCV